MDSRLFRITALIVMVLLIFAVMRERNLPEEEMNPGLIVFELIIIAVLGGLLFVTWLLPALGDKISEGMMGSGEKAEETPSSRAVGLIARGDYQGAILEFEKMAAASPADRYPVVEISRIYRDKLDDPDGAIQTLHTALVSREWRPEDEVFLRLRMADIQVADKKDFAAAREAVQAVVTKFEGTPHAANATHKLRQIDEEEYLASRQS